MRSYPSSFSIAQTTHGRMWMWIFICFLPFTYSRCYWSNKTPYQYFGTKTPYDVVRGDFRDVSPVPGCEPVGVWFMTRHGVRHPNAEDAALMKEASLLRDDILKMYAEGKGEMCAQDISDLRDWTWNDKLDNTTSKLTSEGFSELHAFGERFGEKFASLLKTLDKAQVRSTKEIRTLRSGDAFIQGLKGFKHPIKVAKPILNDAVARPYRYCKTRLEVIRSTKIISEISKYQETREFQQTLANVQNLTGLSYLEARIVMGMYDLCRFYRAYTVLKRSPWCAFFNDEDLQILEYVEDIRLYFRNGYGHPMNLQLGAASLKDLYEKFDNAIKNGFKILTGYFTHDTMIEMIYTAMGLYHDFPEISGFERDVDRKWRTSFLTPFTANFVAVLHRCTENVTHSYNVQFFVNEKEFHLCNARICSWQDFKNKFEQFTAANLNFCDSTK